MSVNIETVTANNIETIRETMAARDQADALEIGCETWPITYEGGQRGQMTRWPNGRGAVAFGGDSLWGDWTDYDDGTFSLLHLDNREDGSVDMEGNHLTAADMRSGLAEFGAPHNTN